MGEVQKNRQSYLAALRSDKYNKGPYIKGQEKPPKGATGYCAIGLPYTIFLNNKGPIIKGLRIVLGLTPILISKIQNEWNDSPLTFPEIADRIELEWLKEQT